MEPAETAVQQSFALYEHAKAVYGPASYSQKLKESCRRMLMISRRCLFLGGLAGFSLGSLGAASALDYPTRTVRWVVGYPPGARPTSWRA